MSKNCPSLMSRPSDSPIKGSNINNDDAKLNFVHQDSLFTISEPGAFWSKLMHLKDSLSSSLSDGAKFSEGIQNQLSPLFSMIVPNPDSKQPGPLLALPQPSPLNQLAPSPSPEASPLALHGQNLNSLGLSPSERSHVTVPSTNEFSTSVSNCTGTANLDSARPQSKSKVLKYSNSYSYTNNRGSSSFQNMSVSSNRFSSSNSKLSLNNNNLSRVSKVSKISTISSNHTPYKRALNTSVPVCRWRQANSGHSFHRSKSKLYGKYLHTKLNRISSGYVLTRGRGRGTYRLLGPKKGLAVHFGHENWNLVLSMMIGIRTAIGRGSSGISSSSAPGLTMNTSNVNLNFPNSVGTVTGSGDNNLVSFDNLKPLSPIDFETQERFAILPTLANTLDSVASARQTVTIFVDYAPSVFQRIRALQNVNAESYLRSVGPEQLLGNMILGNLSSLSELSSEGKSGAFFYYTADGRYMIKTVSKEEKELLKGMLPSYMRHLESQRNNFLTKFFGLHSLRIRKKNNINSQGGININNFTNKVRRNVKTTKIYFVVMANLFSSSFEIHRRFDLKGSSLGRKTRNWSENVDRTVALKDLDWIDMGPNSISSTDKSDNGVNTDSKSTVESTTNSCQSVKSESNSKSEGRDSLQSTNSNKNPQNLSCQIPVSPYDYHLLTYQLRKDAEFLASLNIIDYSLLVGIHEVDSEDEEEFANAVRGVDSQFEASQTHELSKIASAARAQDSTTNKNSINTQGQAYHERHFGGLAVLKSSLPPQSKAKSQLIFLGVIDILTNYGVRKRVEHASKGCFYHSTTHCGEAATVLSTTSCIPIMGRRRGKKNFVASPAWSCCPPKQYAARFSRFMQERLFRVPDSTESTDKLPLINRPRLSRVSRISEISDSAAISGDGSVTANANITNNCPAGPPLSPSSLQVGSDSGPVFTQSSRSSSDRGTESDTGTEFNLTERDVNEYHRDQGSREEEADLTAVDIPDEWDPRREPNKVKRKLRIKWSNRAELLDTESFDGFDD